VGEFKRHDELWEIKMNAKNSRETQAAKLVGEAAVAAEKNKGYQLMPFSANRRMVAASASVGREQNNIQALLEVDISKPRRFIQKHSQRTGERLSFTAYVVTCLAKTVAEFPSFNTFRKGRHLILLDNLTLSVMVEREINGELVPEPLGIQSAQQKNYRQIHEAIRTAQAHPADQLGGLSGVNWLSFIPGFLLRPFIRVASQNISVMKRYGAISVTSVGMFGTRNQAAWGIPIVGGATLAVTIGGMVDRPYINAGQVEPHEHLCLTVTFNHDIIDGAPAARFLKRFSSLLKSAEILQHELETDS
jgi:pyruvate/2-oxoglutarate dehydrogenase complex dihydrolipoamide acyltransferase (E2) component